MNTYLEIDVTSWLPDGSEKLGTHPKRWLRDPESRIRWLMKDTTSSKASDGSTYRKGDDWSERIATGVADSLDLPAARTELAVQYDGDETRLGVISKTVLSGSNEKLVLGQRLLKGIIYLSDNWLVSDLEVLSHPLSRLWAWMGSRSPLRLAQERRSARVGTVMQDSKLGYQEWVIAVYLYNTSLIDRTFDDALYLQLDHNTPRSDGGINHITNRVLLCGPCNQIKSNIYTLPGLRRENRRCGRMAR